jgi:hypothetical protein
VIRYAAALLALVGLCTVALPASDGRRGIFALQGATAAVDAVMTARVQPEPLRAHLELWMTPRGRAVAITSYDEEMTQRIHLIVVSDDLRTFLHVHPALGRDGHFRIDQPLPRRARYLVYADAIPHGFGQQVFRFALDAGGAAADRRDLSERGTTAHVDGYTVTLSASRVRAGTATALAVHVTKGGRPAGDLHPYLGTLAHAVFLDARDLSYVHVHAGELAPASPHGEAPMGSMGSMGSMESAPLPDGAVSSPAMSLHVMLAERGTYKLWLQFRGGGALHVAAFVIRAE